MACHSTLTYQYSTEMIQLSKSAFSQNVSTIVRKSFEILNLLQWTAIWKAHGCRPSNDTIAHNLSQPSQNWSVEKRNKSRKLDWFPTWLKSSGPKTDSGGAIPAEDCAVRPDLTQMHRCIVSPGDISDVHEQTWEWTNTAHKQGLAGSYRDPHGIIDKDRT